MVVVDIVLALAKELNDRCIGRSMVRSVGITLRGMVGMKKRGGPVLMLNLESQSAGAHDTTCNVCA